ncbi:centrosomal protein of 104 kDa [Arapaima gigas]
MEDEGTVGISIPLTEMPQKLGFKVLGASSHEDGFSAMELLVHAPMVSGWRSARHCSYPQEIILQLAVRSHIRKLQLLAHPYMISAKIEFHIADGLPDPPELSSSRWFHRLGYVSLSDNEKTEFKARELKSIHVDVVGTYMRLTFHKNYANRYNLFNQVALVAINVLGDPVNNTEMDIIVSVKPFACQLLYSLSIYGSFCASFRHHVPISPLDDLAFDMYQDPEVAHIIRRLEERKQESVRQERYDLAKTLKQAMADLQKVGELLGRLDVEKHYAIEKEDYDTARQKKEQMEEYRRKVYRQLELHDLLDTVQVCVMADFHNEDSGGPCPSLWDRQTAPPPESQQKIAQDDPAEREHTAASPPASQQIHTLPAVSLAQQQVPQVYSLPFDERPLPTLVKQPLEEEQQRWIQAGETKSSADLSGSLGVAGEPEPLTEKAQREASFPSEVYGDTLVAKAYSKIWIYREDALLTVCKKLTEVDVGTPREELRTMARAAVFLVKKALSDPVSSVLQASLKLLKTLLIQFIPGHKLGKAEVAHCVEQTWVGLLARTGDSSGRVRATATSFIQEMALFKEVRSLQTVPVELVKPLPPGMPARPALSRTQLLERLLPELGTGGVGFALDGVMRFSTGALEHSASEVRESAVRIILAMYQQHKHSILAFLPPDDATTRKNMVYRKIFDAFAKIDGRPAELQIKGLKRNGTQKVKEEKKGEILSLQEQLAVLKEISDKENGNENTRKTEKGLSKPTKADVGRGAPTTRPSHAGSEHSPETIYLDSLCIFCGERNDSFTDEGLDLHYWKHCPMLLRCEQCKQVVEICSLTEHRLMECESRATFAQCHCCGEAIPREVLPRHTQSLACQRSEETSNHCPLCHDNFTSGEEAWKSHLMGKDGCKQNPRRTAALQRAKLSQGKTVSMKTAKQVPLGTRSRPTINIGRTPAPKTVLNRTTRHLPARRLLSTQALVMSFRNMSWMSEELSVEAKEAVHPVLDLQE